MANLNKYFKRQSLLTSVETGLPQAVTREANIAVEKVLDKEHAMITGSKRKYTHFAPEARVKIAKYAVESGNAAAVRNFPQNFFHLEKALCVFLKSST